MKEALKIEKLGKKIKKKERRINVLVKSTQQSHLEKEKMKKKKLELEAQKHKEENKIEEEKKEKTSDEFVKEIEEL